MVADAYNGNANAMVNGVTHHSLPLPHLPPDNTGLDLIENNIFREIDYSTVGTPVLT